MKGTFSGKRSVSDPPASYYFCWSELPAGLGVGVLGEVVVPVLLGATAGSGSKGTGGGVVAMTYPIQPRIARTARTATKADISSTISDT